MTAMIPFGSLKLKLKDSNKVTREKVGDLGNETVYDF